MSKMNNLLLYKNDSMKLLTFYRKIKSLSEGSSEKLARNLCDDVELFDELPVIKRVNKDEKPLDYREKNSKRQGEKQINPKSDKTSDEKGGHKRNEEHIAMDFFKNCKTNAERYDKSIGYVLDYQTPIGGNLEYLYNGERIQNPDYKEKHNYSPGKCDLMSYNKHDDIIYILELKDEDSKEPLISAVVEAYTYLKLFDKDELRDNMKRIYPELGINANTDFVAAPLIYKGGKQYKELKYENVRKLIDMMDEKVFVYSGDKKNYDVEEYKE